MTTNLGEFFDIYSIRARLQPAFLAFLPLIVTIYGVWQAPELQKLWLVFVAAGGTFFLANFVRSRGVEVERSLLLEWDGWPTTRALRLRSSSNNVILRDRRRARLQEVTGIPLPTVQDEHDDPRGADTAYEAATRILISKVRERSDIFPRVQEENIHYGFRRNLYALKPLAVVLLAIVAIIWGLAAVRTGLTTHTVLAGGFDAFAVIAWTLVIKPSWALQAGERYAERLLETLEGDSLSSQRAG